MYLKHIRANNFRAFGDGKKAPALDWALRPGLNILVGENDAGKTTIVDAIRQILLTTSYENIRLYEHDFHIHGTERATSLWIEATLCDLSSEQQASVLEWLTHESDGSCSLIIHLSARWIPPQPNKRARVEFSVRAGKEGIGQEIGSTVRELIRATYLRPLRDAEAELRPGRQSRLSQILAAHKNIDGQEVNDFQTANPNDVPKNIVGLMAFSQHHIGEHTVIKSVEQDINQNYLEEFSFESEKLQSRIRITPDLSLTPILEKFELALLPGGDVDPNARCARGLGYNNALFMATELVLLREGDDLALLLIEEPEAHLHPQLQYRVMDLLENHSKTKETDERQVQVVMTTHSPSLVSHTDIENMTLVHKAQTFPLSAGNTKLKKTDYSFLRRFIEATKANLFFARGVMMVEGPAEAILLPTLAEVCDRSLSKHGVSLVNVGHTGLFHYARILQVEGAGPELKIPVVCLTDRDIVPESAKTFVSAPGEGKKRFTSDYNEEELAKFLLDKSNRAQGGSTIVCISDKWTLEYDLAYFGCAKLMYYAIQLGRKAKTKGERLEDADETKAKEAAKESWEELETKGLTEEELANQIFKPLYNKEASKAIVAQYAAELLLSGEFGSGDELFNRLPPYLKKAFIHLTGDKSKPATKTETTAVN
ncbi:MULTISPECIES: ATP-dependent endonuclease [unclassified Methylophilus]|jgi:putative ATP-dependent endonuclease of OLD family|uniref:ATP-dependent endonuclease n=1 Tax=Methylophilus glucosoxydans TaxID=752553 RepID=A0ABW3GMW6_9PROT|nr:MULTISPECIES: AAA family ATPase [unclassified Methylophilus]MBF4988303.1 AAA family ATPase [Methylophilus sp. 14]MBF4990770.1 AAA family ATPase [Methylophilus sp. QUAN]